MTKQPKTMHICSPCGLKFKTEAEYLAHKCKVSGKKPTDVEHLKATTTPNFDQISAAAQQRGKK